MRITFVKAENIKKTFAKGTEAMWFISICVCVFVSLCRIFNVETGVDSVVIG